MGPLSRRGFFAVSAGGLLVACTSGSGSAESGTGARSASGQGPLALIRYFPDQIHVAGRPERLPFGIADAEGVPLSDGPESFSYTVSDPAGATVLSATASRHREGLPRAYYPVEVDLPGTGVHVLRATVDGRQLESLFTLNPARAAGPVGVGDRLPPFATPTTGDPRGVDPVCTRPEPCPFHRRTLTEALATGRPVAYLVGTPAHCQTGICGPVLDLLVDASASFPGVEFVHAEVFADPDGRKVAPAVDALGLDYEPVLYLTGADGVVRSRLDIIYDTAELRSALTAASR